MSFVGLHFALIISLLVNLFESFTHILWGCLTGNGAIIENLMPKSHNAPAPYPTMHHFATEMCTCAHFCYKMVLCGIFVWWNMEFVRWFWPSPSKVTLKDMDENNHQTTAKQNTAKTMCIICGMDVQLYTLPISPHHWLSMPLNFIIKFYDKIQQYWYPMIWEYAWIQWAQWDFHMIPM